MTAEKIVKYLEENEEVFNRLIEELDSWNGFLGDDRWNPMYDLDEVLSGESATDIIRLVQNSSFDINDDYFRFDGYGSLESAYSLDYSDYLDESFVKKLADNMDHIDIDDPKLERMLRNLNGHSNWKEGGYE